MVSSSTNIGLSISFLVTTFHFWVVLNKCKNKSMGNCISKINKDHFFAIEEFMKNDNLFSNGIIRFGLDTLTGGDIYEASFHKKRSRKNSVCCITNWGMVEGPFFKNKLTPKYILCYPKRSGTLCHPFRIIFKHSVHEQS